LSKPVHVALVIQDLYRLGGQYVTALVARGLVARGYRVDLVVSKVHRDLGKERPDLRFFEVPDAVRWIHLKSRKASRNVWGLARYFRRETPNVVISMSSNYNVACGLAMCFCWRRRPWFISTEHAGTAGGLTFPGMKITKHSFVIIKRWAQAKLLKNAVQLLTVSEGIRTRMLACGWRSEQVITVFNPVVDDAFWVKRQKEPSHPWLKNKTYPVFVAAGAHVSVKGHTVLLHAFVKVTAERICRLIIFGEGKETENLKQLAKKLKISDQVDFPGFTNNLPANLKLADGFVVSSYLESFSVVLVEALACGVPVVSTNCPSGPPEILQQGKFGILCEVNNPDSLAEGMLKILNGKGITPPQVSWEPYTLERVMDTYEQVIHTVLKKGQFQKSTS